MAIGEVTDFGAMLISIRGSAPNNQPNAMPSTVASVPATTRVSRVGQNNWRIRRRLRNSGTARATVAGPRRMVRTLALALYSS